MDDSYDSNRRRTRVLTKSPLILDSESESFEDSDTLLNITTKYNDTLTNESETQEELVENRDEDDTYCDQLREMTPKKITQLLDKLELNEFENQQIQESGELQEDIHSNKDYQENPQQKKTKATKIKKEPNKPKQNRAIELELNDKEEPVTTKVEISKEANAKPERLKKGQKEGVNADNLINNTSNKAVANSKSTYLVPPEDINDEKPIKSKKAVKGKAKEAVGEKVTEEKPKDKETSSKSKTATQLPNLTDSTVVKEKNPPNKKKQEVKAATLKEKSSKVTKKTVNETDDLKESKTTKDDLNKKTISKNEGKTVPMKTRAQKAAPVVEAKENKEEVKAVKVEEKPTGRSRRNKIEMGQEVSKCNEKGTLLVKETVENPKNKVNSAKQKIAENSENKENKAKNSKAKPKTVPKKQDKPVVAMESFEEVEEIVKKRAIRKNK